jgi:hypothetical protein
MKNKLVKKTTKLYRFQPVITAAPPTTLGGDPTNTTITVLTTVSRVVPVQRGAGK